MPTAFLTLLLAIHSPKPDVSLKFSDISISRAIGAAKLVGVRIPTPLVFMGMEFKLEGTVGLLLVEVRGHVVTAKMTKVQLSSDSSKREVIESVWMTMNRKTSQVYVKAYALGGILELEGVIPR